MKKLSFLAAVGLLPTLATAQSSFNGTWKVDLNRVDFSKQPDVYVLQGGMYQCKTCVPSYTVKADGTDQPVSGHPYFDSVAIKVLNGNTIEETDKKNGKVVATSTSTVSPDGNTMSFSFSDQSNTNGGSPVTGKGEETRTAKGPEGSHPISGSWKMAKMENISDNAIAWTYQLSGEELTMSSPTGQSYTAKLNGADAPMKGDPGITSVSVRMLGQNTLEETDKRDGKVISVLTMTIGADGKTAKAVAEDKLQDRKTEFVAVKQ